LPSSPHQKKAAGLQLAESSLTNSNNTKKMQIPDIIRDPKNRLNPIADRHRAIVVRAASLRAWITELEEPFLNSLGAHGYDLTNVHNNGANLVAFSRSQSGNDLVNARTLLAIIEASPEYAEALSIMQPVLKAIAADVAQEDAALEREREVNQALADAEAAARAQAEADLQNRIDSDPQVKAARKALAGIKRLGEPLVV
jgi:hypothetical protein